MKIVHQGQEFTKNRWWVLLCLFLITFINYFDRQTLGCAIEPIGQEFELDNPQRGALLAAFVTTYAIAHLFMGFITDRIKNIKLFFSLMVVGWSACTIVMGFAQNYESLIACRYALGVFEAVNFPICLMIIASIFPAKERTLASGIFSSGAFLATLAAPKFTIYFSTYYSWRYSFIIAGAIGLLWLLPWFAIYKDKTVHKTQAKLADINSWLTSFRLIISKPAFWAVTILGLGIVPCLYFATQWLPSFFTQALGQSYDQALANKLTVIYLFQDMGMWTSGAIVYMLANKGLSVLKSRKIVLSIGYLLLMSIVLAIFVKSAWTCVIVFSVFIFGLGMCLSNQHAFKQDILPGQVAAVAALVGFCETFFTSFVLKRIGVVAGESGDFTLVIIALAVFATIAIFASFLLLRKKWITIE